MHTGERYLLPCDLPGFYMRSGSNQLRLPPEGPPGSGFALYLRPISQALRKHSRDSESQQNAEFITEYSI
ncbi:Urease accessory protein UreG [Trichinella spiralis]|uniref:Urease accessory protein UreG n=1 Tax=Trichinella spiralis TaxID=6334 RepID=A0ABR3KES0_TRISP